MPGRHAMSETARQRPGRSAWLPVWVAALVALAGPAASPAWGQDEVEELEGADTVRFSAFTDAVDLSTIVDFVARELEINIVVKGALTGSVVFNAPVEVERTTPALLSLLDALLEQHNYTITQDTSGFYIVTQANEAPRNLGEQLLPTTRVIEIPNIKPSTLQPSLDPVIGGGLTYIDELGIIIVTNTPRQIARTEQLIETLIARYKQFELTPIHLDYLAASVARERILALAGTPQGSAGPNRAVRRQGANPADQAAAIIGAVEASGLDNLAERLAIDPQGNALIFRGTPDELDRVLGFVELVDRPVELPARTYEVGGSAQRIAEFARQRGLGVIVELDDPTAAQVPGVGRGGQQALTGGGSGETIGGPTMIVDARQGQLIYYGTEEQQRLLAELIDQLEVAQDRVVIRHYKLDNAQAVDVAEIIQALLTGQTQAGTSPLLPGGRGQPGVDQFLQQRFGNQDEAPIGEGEIGEFDAERTFVVADEGNNQIVVKAPIRQQEDFRQLIRRLDLRRPQVYIETLIVTVADSKDFRLAVETQTQLGDVELRTNFGLSSIATGAGFGAGPVDVATGLGGLTAALIQSEYIPFILTALQTDTDTRIVSAPQLLVNDNEEATISTTDQEPTTSTQIGETSDITSFSGFEEAGTTLTVTPSISEAGYLRMQVELNFSNFEGAGSAGIPPPRVEREVSTNVTVPSDSTIIVGGITVENVRNTIVKIPLLGDIPLLGLLFRDTNEIRDDSVLYFFITPRIMVDPNFQDLKLLTRGPQSESEIEPMLPSLQPQVIEMIEPARRLPAEPIEPDPGENPAPTPPTARTKPAPSGSREG